MRKSARTISGVTPVAVMTRPGKCPGQCVYCPTFESSPQSYTPNSPAVIRARACDYDIARQVQLRLKMLEKMGHPTDKVELIIMGGTFLATPVEYQYSVIKDCFDALNGAVSGTLEEAKQLNERAAHRCTGLCIETRPDWCGEAEVQRMLEFGATRVELGVQMLDDEIYRLVKRGHGVADVVAATALLKRYGLKVHYHWMPGLPGSSPEKDLELSRLLFNDGRFRPDGLKIYPTMVVTGTGLEEWYHRGDYQPYKVSEMVNLIAGIKSAVPKYVRISRVLRDIPSQYIIAGCRDSLRGTVRQRMRELGTRCQCIRCREYGHRQREGWSIGEPHLVRMDYEASGGREIMLSFEDVNETLFGLLRLRVQPAFLPGIDESSPVVRELHVYGPEIPLTRHSNEAAQHKGLGRALLLEAERIAREEFQARRLAVLSGVGAREYYANFGYNLAGNYMVKDLSGVNPGPVEAASTGNH